MIAVISESNGFGCGCDNSSACSGCNNNAAVVVAAATAEGVVVAV